MKNSKRVEILPRVPGSEIPTSFHLGRCEAERWLHRPEAAGANQYGWVRARGCDLAFFFRLPSGGHNADVSCPGCGLSLDITTRRLRAGFLPLSDADVKAIRSCKGQPVEVSSLGPIVASAPEALAPVEAPARASKRQAALDALAKFDAKPRCQQCWRFNPSSRKSALCNDCREDGPAAYGIEQERDGYTSARREIVERVERWGGVAGPAPVGQDAYEAHLAERRRKNAEWKAKRVAELRAQGCGSNPHPRPIQSRLANVYSTHHHPEGATDAFPPRPPPAHRPGQPLRLPPGEAEHPGARAPPRLPVGPLRPLRARGLPRLPDQGRPPGPTLRHPRPRRRTCAALRAENRKKYYDQEGAR